MKNKELKELWENRHLQSILKNLQTKEEKTDPTDEKFLKAQKNQAEINQLEQQTESLKESEGLKKPFTWFTLGFLFIYSILVIVPIWFFIFCNPEVYGVHYILIALIGSLTVGVFKFMGTVAGGIFGKDKK